MAPGSPQPLRPDDGLHSSLAEVAEEGGLCCLEGDPRGVGHATLGEGHGLPIVLHLFLLLNHSPGVALGASAGMHILHGPELLAFVGVLGVEVMVHAVPAALG